MAPSHLKLSDQDLDLLSAYLDDALSDRERFELECRLQDEVALRKALDGLRQTVDLLHALPRLKAPRSFALDPANFSRERRQWTWLSFASVMQFSGALGLAASMVLIVTALISGPGDAGKPSSVDYSADVAVALAPTGTEIAETAIAYAGDDLLQSTIAAQTSYYATREAAPSPAPGWEAGGVAGNSAGQALSAEDAPPQSAPDAGLNADEVGILVAPPGAIVQEAPALGAAPAPESAGASGAEGAAAQAPGEAPAPVITDAGRETEQSQREADAAAQTSPTPLIAPTTIAASTAISPSPTSESAPMVTEELTEPPPPAMKMHAELTERRTDIWPEIGLGAVLGGISLALLLAGIRRARHR